jgi:hypothetical protein
MTERQSRRRCCSGSELALSGTSSVRPARWRPGGENLALLALELIGCDDAADVVTWRPYEWEQRFDGPSITVIVTRYGLRRLTQPG